MTSFHLFFSATLALGFLGGAAQITSAQAPATDALRTRFRQLDANASGWLSGRELDACQCRASDTNHDGEVTWDEFSSSAQNAVGTVAPATQVFRIPDRVEVNYGGTWYPGSIYAARDGQYKVLRDNFTSDDRWLTAADLRPLAAPARTTPLASAATPRTVALGTYTCMTISGGFSTGTPSGAVLGQLRVTSAGTYTSLVRDGTGTDARFTYDSASGTIAWDGGTMQGFFGKVIESRFGLDNRGTPVISVVYRVREGGNLFDLSCRREGA